MQLRAIFLGSIGVLAETSDIQRRAYNQALREAGLDWHWDKHRYRQLLTRSGGRARLAKLASQSGVELSDTAIEQIHARKTELACAEVVATRPPPRPGIASLVSAARDQGLGLALVTTTYSANIDAILTATSPQLSADSFDAILTVDDCDRPKPDPEIYQTALTRFGLQAEHVLAIEDSEASLRAATAAGIHTVATPGAFTRDQDFSAATRVLDSLDGLEDPRELAEVDFA